ncbi:MAG TPA: Uma2 family endonuclease, partial [Pirellulales bacterium]|nr:Uma2 family endonuclease [Pirellulales bacterium]
DSDGEPLGETQFHIIAILHIFGALRQFFRGRSDVCVLADSFMYYEQANEIKKKAPDVMVALGVSGNHPRRSFRISEEGVVPAVIFEITSKKTHEEDEHGKKETYAWLGVKEYFLFDPEDLSIDPRLQGFQLREGQYVPLLTDVQGRLTSRELGMLLEPDDILLRLIDTRTGRRLMTFEELFEVADEAERKVLQAREQAEQAREQAEQAREQAEQAREQAEQAREQAEQAREQAEQAREQVEIERQRNLVLELELAQLRAARRKAAEE